MISLMEEAGTPADRGDTYWSLRRSIRMVFNLGMGREFGQLMDFQSMKEASKTSRDMVLE